MSEATIAALLEALKKLSPQDPTTLITPSFDWSLKDQYNDFQFFVKSMDSWFTLQDPRKGRRVGEPGAPQLHLEFPQ